MPIARDRLLELYSSGLTQVEIAEQLGVLQVSVSYWMKKFGILVRKKPKTKLESLDVPTLVDLYDSGQTVEQLATSVGCGTSFMNKVLRQGGAKIRTGHHGYAKPLEQHHGWKGSDAGYKALHKRVGVLRGKPPYCEHCQTTDPGKRYEWASISYNYADPMDYKRLCKLCHRRFDLSRESKSASQKPCL